MDSSSEGEASFTKTPNSFFDKLLAEIDTLSELKVTLAVIRKTHGWQGKPEDMLSFSQLVELTGLSRPMVKQGIDTGVKRGSIRKRPHGQSFIYSIVCEDYQGEAPASARGSKLEEARQARQSVKDKRVREQVAAGIDNKPAGLDAKPIEKGISGLDTKPLTGLVNKHTKERFKEIINPSPNGEGLTPPAPGQQDENVSSGQGYQPARASPQLEAIPEKEPDPDLDPTTQHPAVLAWRETALKAGYRAWPNPVQRQDICDTVDASDEVQLRRWKKTLNHWAKHDYRFRNVPDMLEVFLNGLGSSKSGGRKEPHRRQ